MVFKMGIDYSKWVCRKIGNDWWHCKDTDDGITICHLLCKNGVERTAYAPAGLSKKELAEFLYQ